MSTNSPILTEERMKMYDELLQTEDRELCEMIQAHFETHPCLPMEKEFKKSVADKLKADELALTDKEKADFANRLAETRIREAKIDIGYPEIDGKWVKESIDPDNVHDQFRLQYDGEFSMKNGSPVSIYTAQANLLSMPNETDYAAISVQNSAGDYVPLGKLNDQFMKNNPMLVEDCDVKLEVMDFSNGQMKNLRIRAIVDTDRMSGDVIDLDESMLPYVGMDEEMKQ